MRWRLAVPVVLALAGSAVGQEVNISYPDWERLPMMTRAAYLAGLVDATYAYPDEETTYKFFKCIGKPRRTFAQLSDNVLAYGQDYERRHPRFRFKTVQEALLGYLGSICPQLFSPL
jgi:hypothetical protein